MRVTIYQPQYFPRLHYFARILQSDIFIIYDNVQLVKKHKYPGGRTDKSYQLHTPIKNADGIQFLKVPVCKGGPYMLNQAPVSYRTNWFRHHIRSMKMAYSRARFFSRVFPKLKRVLEGQFSTVSDLNTSTITWALKRLVGSIETKGKSKPNINQLLKSSPVKLKRIVRASELNIGPGPKGENQNLRAIRLIKAVSGDEEFCGGTALSAYTDRALFERHGIILTKQNWKCSHYRQLFWRCGFQPNLSIIDLLMNEPPKKALALLLS